jgi:hypothetical protein
MKKGLIIKLAIVLIVLVLSYCVFWFFKAGQSEKQINKFIADNSTNLSSGEIAVSGFPINQKIVINDLKITVPVNLVAKRQIHFKQIEAKSSIFSNKFVVNFTDVVKVQEIENSGEIYDIEFANQPELSFTIADGVISELTYIDNGFKVMDAEKNIVNSTTGTTINSTTTIGEADVKTSKIQISLKELEGYTLIDFFKNVLEKKVIEGIKTEEIKVVEISPNQLPSSDPNVPVMIDPNAQLNPNAVPPMVVPAPNGQVDANPTQIPSPAQMPAPSNNGQIVAVPTYSQSAPVPIVEPSVAVAVPTVADVNAVPSQPTDVPPANLPVVSNDPNSQAPSIPPVAPDAISDTKIVKSNVVLDFTITTTPSIQAESAEPSDPSQIQELPVQYVQNIKIDLLEFSNPLYKINVSGNVAMSSDDNYPSGGITVKVEKIVNLLSQLKNQFKQLSESKKVNSLQSGADLSVEQAQSLNLANYQIFLSNISIKIMDVAMENAIKNSVTKDDIAQFDVRREKNLEFLINEVPVREIVGKF